MSNLKSNIKKIKNYTNFTIIIFKILFVLFNFIGKVIFIACKQTRIFTITSHTSLGFQSRNYFYILNKDFFRPLVVESSFISLCKNISILFSTDLFIFYLILLSQPNNLPITKRQQQNKYTNSKSNHPPTILKQIQKMIETRNSKTQVTKTYLTT